MTGKEHKAIRRSIAGLTQKRWGDIVGVCYSAVSDWERDKYPVPPSVWLLLLRIQEAPELLFWAERARGLRGPVIMQTLGDPPF